MSDTEVKLNNPYIEYLDGVYWINKKAEKEEKLIREQLRVAYPEAARRADELARRLTLPQREDRVPSR
jgi:hypothetical protein